MGPVKIAFWGLNFWGANLAKLAVDKEKIKIVGVISTNSYKEKKREKEKNYAKSIGIEFTEDVLTVLEQVDLVIISLNEGIHKTYEKIKIVVENKVNCIVIDDEMTYPFIQYSELSEGIDRLAKVNGVTVLGMGINSGFALDTMIIALSSACNKIDAIEARRINDISVYSEEIVQSYGVGLSFEKFEEEFQKGNIAANAGLKQSLQLISKVLELNIERVEENVDPIISNTFRENHTITIEPGEVVGCNHMIYGFKGDKAVIILEHAQEFYPQCEAIDIGDYINIKGETELNLSLQPKKQSGIDTVAIALNMVLKVVVGESGLKTMIDFPIFREFQKEISDETLEVHRVI